MATPEEMTVAQLRERAAELEITGRSGMNKEDLLTAVSDAEAQLAPAAPAPAAATPAAAPSRPAAAPFDQSSDEDEAEADEAEVLTGDDVPVSPSTGSHSVIEREPPEVRLERGEQPSQVDAMGLDKRRQVVGGSYSPSFAKQATLYGIFVAVILGLAIGGKILVDDLDAPPETNPVKAPWAQAEAPQTPPERIQ